MKKNLFLLMTAFLMSCNDHCKNTAQLVEAKNKTIDSLKAQLEDCKAQAKIMAEVLENDK
ncbi:MAG: hypothetical protein E2590_05540 [Chryseobacterium sp.]|nr:hypothetical protein [Chryseobacterium sp.]